ncbi:MAG: DUF1573 domain-containing protein [Bacteroidota bacterium]
MKKSHNWIFTIFFIVTSAVQARISEHVTITPENGVDFGTFEVKSSEEILEKIVKVKNTSKKPIQIEDIKTSCSCTISNTKQIEIQPNESYDLKISLNLQGIYGKKNTQTVLIFSDKSFFVIPVSVETINNLMYSPLTIDLVSGQSKDSSNPIIKFTRLSDTGQNHQAEVSCDIPDISFSKIKHSASPVEASQATAYYNEYLMDLSALLPGKYTTTVLIRYPDGLKRKIPAKINIQNTFRIIKHPKLVKLQGQTSKEVEIVVNHQESQEIVNLYQDEKAVAYQVDEITPSSSRLKFSVHKKDGQADQRWVKQNFQIAANTGSSKQKLDFHIMVY